MADVWITWCKRTHPCRYCEQPLLPGTPMVKVRFIDRRRHWRIHRNFHPNCWVEQGIKALPEYGYGKLTKEQRELRKKLLQRGWSTRHRLAVAMEANNQPAIARLYMLLEGIKTDLGGVGGVPKKWSLE